MVKFQKCARALVLASLVATVSILAGCGSDQPQDVHIRGKLTLAGGGKLPAGASARISLVEHDATGSDNRIVAERTLHDLGKLPVNFNLAVGSELLGTGGQYGLSAQVLDKSGDVRWQTPVPQAVTPRTQQQPALLMLQANNAGMAGDFRHYRCDDNFRFDMAHDPKYAVLRMGKRQISLEASKDSGKKTAVYADDHDDQLIFGHDKITLKVDGASHMNCAVQQNNATATSPDSTEPQGSDTQNDAETSGNDMSQPSQPNASGS